MPDGLSLEAGDVLDKVDVQNGDRAKSGGPKG